MYALIATACGGGGGTNPPVVATLAISPAAIDTFHSRGLTQQLSVQAKDGAGNVVGNAVISFATGNQAVATVSTSGLVTAQGDGKTNITASSGTVSKAVEVNVRRKVITITVTPATRTLAPSQTQSLTVRALDALGQEVIGGPAATFVSSNTAAATVNGEGLVTAVAAGTSTITATMVTVDGTRTATSEITVTTQSFPGTADINLLAASFSPTSVDITAGGTVRFINNSTVEHNVTFPSLSANNIQNHTSGTNTRTFGTAGSFDFNCTIHPGMAGTVVAH
jgi:plastocyanin